MNWEAKLRKLRAIYERFEEDVRPMKKDAVCRLGCTFCCTQVGNVDINTLEGLVIREKISRLPRSQRQIIQKKLSANINRKKKQSTARCAFLAHSGACIIYDVRPFSCRQLYSLRTCGDQGPTVHRQAVERARMAVQQMQQLDDSGYSGHLSYVLHLLDDEPFRQTYINGRFDPSRIMDFGKSHGIVINRFAGTEKTVS